MEKSEIYKAVNAVQAHLASVGVSKTQTNRFDKYKFRGIDDIYNALAPALAENSALRQAKSRLPNLVLGVTSR